MRGNAQKLCHILALSVFLLGFPRVPLHTYAVHAASTVYDVVSPGTLSPGSPVPPPTELYMGLPFLLSATPAALRPARVLASTTPTSTGNY